MTTGVYIITNTINYKCYVGSSVNIEHRWTGKYNRYLTSAFNKYGINNFSFEILAICNPIKEDLLYFEQKCINLFKPEYNILKVAGSPLGSKDTEETKLNKSIAAINRGYSQSAIEAMKQANIGNTYNLNRIVTEETKQKMSNTRQGKSIASKGKPWSEARRKAQEMKKVA